MRHLLQILFIGLLHSLFTWILAMGNCDTTNCPIVCAGPCSAGPSPFVLNPTGPPISCQELIIESPGYPNGYVDNPCLWTFRMELMPGNVRASIVIDFLDFDVGTGDNLLIQGIRGGNPPFDIFNDDTPDALPNSGQISNHVNRLAVQFIPLATRYDQRGFRIRIMFSIRVSATACGGTQTLEMSQLLPSAALNSPRYPSRYQDGSECYYTIISPSDTRINLEFMGTLDIEDFEDFVYIYDSSSQTEPNLLRIVSQGMLPQWTQIQTHTNRVQIAFQDNLSNREQGFFIRASFEVEATGLEAEFTPSISGTTSKTLWLYVWQHSLQ
ncbi:Cubilin [Holothuria leucospilota]|uniref:Cubilin n=1 Tax=Holothuria leucospilota TaxID=206669 RepID=A0A9Q1CTC8_HOLLE|nr:Cubilin [Holothuria leucospilota]